MKSTSGAHFLGLDHVRGLAALLVVSWHFMHGQYGYPTPFNSVPVVFPLVLFDEGHVGVSVFMTLSGYLFAKLLDGKQIVFRTFLWNRVLRLAPLLLIVFALAGIRAWRQGELAKYAGDLLSGVLLPTWPNGGWSITVECHFYLALPALLWMSRRTRWAPLMIVATALCFRALLHSGGHEVQPVAYWTIIGRIDQFAFGMLAFSLRAMLKGRHAAAALVFLGLCGCYLMFDLSGGFWNPAYPSKSAAWVVLPAIDGLCLSLLIAWYDTSFQWRNTGLARWIGKAGDYSYSIYLLHVFIVFKAAAFVHERIMPLDNFYLSLAWSILFFLLMMPIGYLSYRFIEAPFLAGKRSYTLRNETEPGRDAPAPS